MSTKDYVTWADFHPEYPPAFAELGYEMPAIVLLDKLLDVLLTRYAGYVGSAPKVKAVPTCTSASLIYQQAAGPVWQTRTA